jgi:voltage-gated potassium channel
MIKRFGLPLILLGVVLFTGTVGYWFIGGGKNSVIDALFMTVITIATIGYTEVVNLSGNPGGQIFTIFIAFFGIGILAYLMSSFTAFIVEGELTQSFRRRRMEREAQRLKNHYVVCGRGEIGVNIIKELRTTGKPYVVVDTNEEQLGVSKEIWIRGDASDNATLLKAGILSALGLFAVTRDDNINLVICISARQLNPGIRIVVRCSNTNNIEKLYKAGADAVVSPTYIGGLRMASEMIRPTTVSFLDTMLHDSKNKMRVEETAVPATFVGKPLLSLGLKKFPEALLLAIKNDTDWIYNPPEDYTLKQGNILVFMTSPSERLKIMQLLQ